MFSIKIMIIMLIIVMHPNQLHYVVQTYIPWVQKCYKDSRMWVKS